MRTFTVLDEYAVIMAATSPEGLCGYIHHVAGRITPVGYFMAYIEEASEIRLQHWSVHVFFRMGLRYDEETRTTDIVVDSLSPKWLGWHPGLPEAIGNLLLRETACCEPMALQVDRFQQRGGVGFGTTWIEDDDD